MIYSSFTKVSEGLKKAKGYIGKGLSINDQKVKLAEKEYITDKSIHIKHMNMYCI